MPTYFLNLTGGLTTRDVSTQDVSHIFIGFISLRPVEGWNLQYRYRNTTIINAYSSDKGGRILWHVRIQSITQNSAKSLVFSLFSHKVPRPQPHVSVHQTLELHGQDLSQRWFTVTE